ncbi:MAG TPA: chromate resistance protein ChrB domain-containing protein [Moraxellaceae bacterium]|nr:chromate resistance protein ChrB domain-containing protein [Moraxellaceae bacterium]
MESWITLILSLSTDNATVRMRAWRSIKASGAATLRDGVYLLPDRPAQRAVFDAIAHDVRSAGGMALVTAMEEPEAGRFSGLFDRREAYQDLLADISAFVQDLADAGPDAQKQVRKLRKTYSSVTETDFFSGDARRRAEAALLAAEKAVTRLLSPDEPCATSGTLPRLTRADYQGRRWATRRRPWVDRLASAWLIGRFIDPHAQILWLDSPSDCPTDALGFDFDGAAFTHVGDRVSFETLVASFGLDDPALVRLGDIVHYLDVGGIAPAEAAGIEQVLRGFRDSIPDDDQLLAAAGNIFDGLLAAFSISGEHAS